MQPSNIQITQLDYNKLHDLLRDSSAIRPEDKHCSEALLRELIRAQVAPSDEIPGDVITLYSRACLRDLETNELMELTIVLPEEIDVEAGRISVLAPLGTAMLGYREGDIIELIVPRGQSRFQVENVLFQPEAAKRLTEAMP